MELGGQFSEAPISGAELGNDHVASEKARQDWAGIENGEGVGTTAPRELQLAPKVGLQLLPSRRHDDLGWRWGMQDQAAAGESVSAIQRPGAVSDTGMK
jgi:hypothetical protein